MDLRRALFLYRQGESKKFLVQLYDYTVTLQYVNTGRDLGGLMVLGLTACGWADRAFGWVQATGKELDYRMKPLHRSCARSRSRELLRHLLPRR